MVSAKIQQMRDKFQAKKTVNPLAVAQPVVKPVVAPVRNLNQNLWMGSIEGGPVNTTVATRTNPVVKIGTPKTTVDYSTLDKWGLQDEIARMTFRMKTWKVTEEDAVNYNRLTRMLSEQNMNQAGTLDTSEIDRLRAEQEKVKMDRMSQDEQALAAFKQQQQAQTARRIADVQEWWARQREAAQTATSFSWFGRSTVNAEQQASIEKQTQQAIQYENAAADLAVQKYQAELQGASAEVLDAYNQQIAQAQWQASSIMQNAQAEASKINASQSQLFGKTLEDIIANSGIKVDVNDEAALKQFISIARNPDGSVNESVVWSLPANYQAIVRAGVQNGIGATSAIDWSKVKFQRIGGTNKAPVYGYIDPITGEVKQASGWQVALMQWWWGGGGWGWSRIWWGAGGWSAWVVWVDISWVNPKDKQLVTLLWQYKDVLDETSYLWLKADANKQAKAQNLLSQITAEYKNAKKLGTLDTGVQRLIDGLVGKWGGLLSLSSYSNDAQSNAVKWFIESLWWQVATPSAPATKTTTSTTAPKTITPKFVWNSWKNRLKQ